MTTYWLEIRGDSPRSNQSGCSDSSVGLSSSVHRATENSTSVSEEKRENVERGEIVEATTPLLNDKLVRLIKWNAEMLARLLRQIIARREATGVRPEPLEAIEKVGLHRSDETVLDEAKAAVNLPTFDANVAKNHNASDVVDLDNAVTEQLHKYVETLAWGYRRNPFHNFEHASHVTMSVTKLLSRIVAPDLDDADEKDLHDHTYGITSDPLTQFSCVFSALIHDIDHQGVPNAQLVKEGAKIASIYKNKSVAEQNSVDLAWAILMQEEYSDLRHVIYSTEAEFRRFRQLIVNSGT